MERNGAARSRGPLGSPSASPKKLGCRRLPAPGHRRPTGYLVLLRGELTLDFPLPAPAYGGQRSQPCIGAYDGRRTRTSDHTSRSRRRRSPVPRSRDASMPALSKCREPNPASVFHRQPPNLQTIPTNPTPQLNTPQLFLQPAQRSFQLVLAIGHRQVSPGTLHHSPYHIRRAPEPRGDPIRKVDGR